MRRRGLLVAVAGLATASGCGGSPTATPTPTPWDYVGRFETSLGGRGVEPTSIEAADGTVRLSYSVDDATESRIRETITVVATGYATTVGYGWEVERLRVTVSTDGSPILRYRIETAWAEAFNRGGTGSEYGAKIEETVERLTATPG